MDLLTRQISSKMDAIPVNKVEVAAYSGVSPASISLGLRGSRDFSIEHFTILNATLDALLRLKKMCEPIPIDFSQVAEVRRLLERVRNNRPIILSASVAPPAATTTPVVSPLHRTTGNEVTDLVAEILHSDVDDVCSKHNWTRQELSDRIVAASAQLRNLSSELSATNADRASLRSTSL